MKFKNILFAITFTCLYANIANANLLNLDDTSVAGKNNTEIEFRGQYGHTKQFDIDNNSIGVEFRYGILENLNLEIGYDRSFGSIFDKDYIGGSAIQIRTKYKLDYDNFTFSISPRYTYSYNNDNCTGNSAYGLNAVGQYDFKYISVFADASYDYIDFYNKLDYNSLEQNTSTFGIGSTIPLTYGFSIVNEIVSQTPFFKNTSSIPTYIGGGLKWNNDKIDFGVIAESGLNRSSQDFILRSALIFKF